MVDNPFEDVLVQLNDIASKVDDISKPVQSLDTVVVDVTGIITDIDDLFVDFNAVCEIIDVVQTVALALNAIPVVGEIADALGSVTAVLNEINADIKPIKVVVDKVDNVFLDIQKGLSILENVMKEVSTVIPDTTNTVAILNALIMIAKPLVEILEGTDTSTRLAKVVDEYNSIKQSISSDVKPIVTGLDDVVSVIDDFVQDINNIISEVKSFISGASTSVSNGKGRITPVKVAVDIIEDMMKPVMWLIHALQWVYDHTVKPVIDEAMKITHIGDLVNDLEADLLKSLNINKILTDIEKTFHLEGLEKYNNIFSEVITSSSVSSIASNFESLKNEVQSYKQGDANEKSKIITDLVKKLIEAIIDTAVDVSKTMGMPPAPQKPTTLTYQQQSSSVTFNSISSKIQSAAASLEQITQTKGQS